MSEYADFDAAKAAYAAIPPEAREMAHLSRSYRGEWSVYLARNGASWVKCLPGAELGLDSIGYGEYRAVWMGLTVRVAVPVRKEVRLIEEELP